MKQTPTQLQQQAQEWTERSPEMWEAFCSRAITSSMNNEEWSARGIAEGLRWDGTYKRAYGSQFKIPNHITPVLGRMCIEKHPETAAWFRHSHSKVDPR